MNASFSEIALAGFTGLVFDAGRARDGGGEGLWVARGGLGVGRAGLEARDGFEACEVLTGRERLIAETARSTFAFAIGLPFLRACPRLLILMPRCARARRWPRVMAATVFCERLSLTRLSR